MKKRISRLVALSLAAVLAFTDAGMTSVIAAEDVIVEDNSIAVEEESLSLSNEDNEEIIVEEDIEVFDDIITDDALVEDIIEEEELLEEAVMEDNIITIDDSEVSSDFSSEDSAAFTTDKALALPTGGLEDVRYIETRVHPSEVVYDVNELYDQYLELKLTDQTATIDDLFDDEKDVVFAENWDKYSSYYTYNLLPTKKQIAWKAYYKICNEVLNSKKNYSSFFGYVSSPGVFTNIDDFMDFFSMFKYSNPQFYFINNGVSGYGGTYSFLMYDNMTKGSARAKCTSKFKSGINSFKSSIKKSSNEGATFKSIHDTICQKVSYVKGDYNQSAYSTFVLKKTVCAGYALALSLLCNDYGIGAQALTAPGHAYNRVRINDTWYNVDVTWADQSWGVYYGYYLQSTKKYAEIGYSAHVPDTAWNKYLPTCTKNITLNSGKPGNPFKPSARVATPKITISGGKVKITTSTSGAKIYYTVNGKAPYSYKTICNVYKGTFKYTKGTTIKAIAVKNGSWDSKVSTK